MDNPAEEGREDSPAEPSEIAPDSRSERLGQSFKNSGERMVRELAPELLLRAARLGLDAEASRDVVQDCFADLWRKRPNPAAVASWLYRAVRWRALDRIRSDRRRQAAESRAIEAGPSRKERPPEERLALRQALAALPLKARRAIIARFLRGAPVSEGGAAAHWKPSSSKKMLARYLARLRRLV